MEGLGFGDWVEKLECRVRIKVEGLWSRVKRAGRIIDSGNACVASFGIWDLGFRVRVWDFGIRNSDFGFRDPGSWIGFR